MIRNLTYKILLQFILMFLLGISSVVFGYPPDVEERIAQVEKNLSSTVDTNLKWTLNKRMNFYNIHGLSIAIVHNYNIEWAKGYGLADISDNTDITTETLFQAGSISKSLNAVGLMKLVEKGKINLYSDINNYLKTWKFPYDSVSKNKKISLANLLSHSAGLSVHGFLGYNINDSLPNLVQILDGKYPANNIAVRSMFEPGLKYQYSGGGTVISQLMTIDVSSIPYSIYMQDSVLNPIVMNESFYTQPPPIDVRSKLATGYSENTEIDGKYHIYPEQSAAGLWTNPTDLCKFIIETQKSLINKSNKVLNQESTKTMLTSFVDKSLGLGVFFADNGTAKYFYHSGSDEGFKALYIGSFEDGEGAAIMVNSNNYTIITELLNSIINVYKWKGYVKNTAYNESYSIPDLSIIANTNNEFIELKAIPIDSDISIFNLNGELILKAKSRNTLDIRGLTAGVYFLITPNNYYKFIKR